jgi:hypothetical protein
MPAVQVGWQLDGITEEGLLPSKTYTLLPGSAHGTLNQKIPEVAEVSKVEVKSLIGEVEGGARKYS